MIGWRHAYEDLSPQSRSALPIEGAGLARDAAVVEAGGDFGLSPGAALGVSYQGQLASGATSHGVRGMLKISF